MGTTDENAVAMTRRDITLAVIAAASGATAVGAIGIRGETSPWSAVSAIAAVALLLWALLCRPRSRDRLARPVALTGCLSLLTTFTSTPPATAEDAHGKLVEMGALLLLLAAVARCAPVRQAVRATVAAGAAVALWTLPLLPSASLLEKVGACAFWSLPVLGAAVCGGYPRLAEHRRRQSVIETRRTQQLELARDLHDFVAHDVSGIVVQAQAARFVAASDPQQAVPALERIERAGLNALASMDRMVRMLHDADGGGVGRAAPHAPKPLPGLEELPALIDRFTSPGATEARLTLAPGAAKALSREAGSTAYRVVVEALTNVRRHAPHAACVDVFLAEVRAPDGTCTVEVRVTNDLGAVPVRTVGRRERDGHGGRGLSGLSERVRAVGGTLSAGPCDGGWQVVAALPGAPALPERAS